MCDNKGGKGWPSVLWNFMVIVTEVIKKKLLGDDRMGEGEPVIIDLDEIKDVVVDPSSIPAKWNHVFCVRIMTEERLDTLPTDVHSSELVRQISGEEATLLGVIQFIVDGAMKAKQQAHNSNIFLQYDADTGGKVPCSLDNSALERLFKGEFLNQDYAKFYTDLLWERQLRLERHGQADRKIRFLMQFYIL